MNNEESKKPYRSHYLIREEIEHLRKKRLEDATVSSPYDAEIKKLQDEYFERTKREYRIPSLLLDIIKTSQGVFKNAQNLNMTLKW